MNEDSRYLCPECGGYVDHRRVKLGYRTCLECGEINAKQEKVRKASMVQIPYSKGAYQYIHNPADLIGTNPKRTT
jgi:ribosomal protein L37AE/L43A